MRHKFRRLIRILRYIAKEVSLDIRAILRIPKVRRFLTRIMNIAIGVSVIAMSVFIVIANANSPVPEDCGGLLLAIPLGIGQMFKS